MGTLGPVSEVCDFNEMPLGRGWLQEDLLLCALGGVIEEKTTLGRGAVNSETTVGLRDQTDLQEVRDPCRLTTGMDEDARPGLVEPHLP